MVLSLDTLPAKGNYTLIVHVMAPSYIKMPKLGAVKLGKGYYAYTGSALGPGATSLRKRVARHFRKTKKKHWHIDYLLAKRAVRITTVVAALSNEDKECQIASLIENIEEAATPIVGFGASDCKHSCKSHLTYLGQSSSLEKVVGVYEHVVGATKLQVYKP